MSPGRPGPGRRWLLGALVLAMLVGVCAGWVARRGSGASIEERWNAAVRAIQDRVRHFWSHEPTESGR